jgi:hypothetical protein
MPEKRGYKLKVGTWQLYSVEVYERPPQLPGYWSRGPGFDSRRYQIFWEVVGLERGPLCLVTTIEELLGRKSSDSDLEIREYGRGDPLRWPRDILYPQKFALISPTEGGRSVGIVRSRTKAAEFRFVFK